MNTDELIILCETKESYIGTCKCCSVINFVFKNIAIKFTPDEFIIFKDYIDNLNIEEFNIESRTGKNIFMSLPVKNIVLCFSKIEIEDLRILMSQASLLMEAKKILGS